MSAHLAMADRKIRKGAQVKEIIMKIGDRTDGRAHSGQMTRRIFLGTTGAAGAAMLTGGAGSLLQAAVQGAAGTPIWIEKSIPELQALMVSDTHTSRELTQRYLQRIRDLNPLLRAVIE